MKQKKLNIMENKKEILICDCHSTEHQIIFLYEEEEDENGEKYPVCYAHIHLNKLSFWRRIIYGVKYIFGYQSRYGAFEEFIFNPEDSIKIQNLSDYLNIKNTSAGRAAIEKYLDGLNLYTEGNFTAAIEQFSSALLLNPNDGPSQTYIKRCEYLVQNPPTEWDGVFHMTTK